MACYLLFLIGAFALNIPIFISTMAVRVFHTDAGGHGLLSSATAIGTVAGALLSAGRDRPCFETLLAGAALFGVDCALAAIALRRPHAVADRAGFGSLMASGRLLDQIPSEEVGPVLGAPSVAFVQPKCSGHGLTRGHAAERNSPAFPLLQPSLS